MFISEHRRQIRVRVVDFRCYGKARGSVTCARLFFRSTGKATSAGFSAVTPGTGPDNETGGNPVCRLRCGTGSPPVIVSEYRS